MIKLYFGQNFGMLIPDNVVTSDIVGIIKKSRILISSSKHIDRQRNFNKVLTGLVTCRQLPVEQVANIVKIQYVHEPA